MATNNSQGWDDDSVNFKILTRPSPDANGQYSVSVTLRNELDNATLSQYSFSINTTANNGVASLLNVKIKLLPMLKNKAAIFFGILLFNSFSLILI